MLYNLRVFITIIVFLQHDVLCFQPAFAERKNLMVQLRCNDQWRNKRTQLQMYEASTMQSVVTLTRRMARGSKCAATTILFTKNFKSKMFVLAHTLFVFAIISSIVALSQYIPKFAKDVTFVWGSIRKIFKESEPKQKQWVRNLKDFIRLRLVKLKGIKIRFSASAAAIAPTLGVNVVNTAGYQMNSIKKFGDSIADIIGMSENNFKSRRFEYVKGKETVDLELKDNFNESITKINGVDTSVVAISGVSSGSDTFAGTNIDFDEILKHTNKLTDSDDSDHIDGIMRNEDSKDHILSTPLPLNNGNGGSVIDSYHSLSTPLFLTTSQPAVAHTHTLQLTPVAFTLAAHPAVASIQPPSTPVPPFYPFSGDVDNLFGASSFLYSSTEKINSDQLMKSTDKGIDVGLIGMNNTDDTGGLYVSLPDYLLLKPPAQDQELSPSYVRHTPDVVLTPLSSLPTLSLVETLEQQLVTLRLQAVEGAEEVQRLLALINTEIKEEEEFQAKVQKNVDSAMQQVDVKAMVQGNPEAEGEAITEMRIELSTKAVKSLNERVESRALEVLQELTLAREKEEEKLMDLTRRVQIEEGKLKQYARLSEQSHSHTAIGSIDAGLHSAVHGGAIPPGSYSAKYDATSTANSSSRTTADTEGSSVKEKKIFGRKDRSSHSGKPSPNVAEEISSEPTSEPESKSKEDSSAAMAAALAMKAQKWMQSAVTTALNPAVSSPPEAVINMGDIGDTIDSVKNSNAVSSNESQNEILDAKEKEKELMRIQAAEAVQEIEATLNAISKEAFACFAKYVSERI